ncbi:UNVERIFIED_CONTAM: hypothetical protein K2H54_040623 [Gekko kuhli]
MPSILMVGLVFACLLHGGDHEDFDVRKFAGIWYHTAEVVNGSLPNELDSVKIKATIGYTGGILFEIRRVRNEQCEQDVIFLEATDLASEFESIRLSRVRFLEADFDHYCIIHVIAQNYQSTFMHLFTRTPEPSDDDQLNFEFFVGVVIRFDLKQIVYLSRTEHVCSLLHGFCVASGPETKLSWPILVPLAASSSSEIIHRGKSKSSQSNIWYPLIMAVQEAYTVFFYSSSNWVSYTGGLLPAEMNYTLCSAL